MRRFGVVVLTLAAAVGFVGGAAAEKPRPESELKAEVPALKAFHGVIYPLWHQAWPNRDTEMMKRLLPKVQEHVGVLQSVELPGILRDKKAAWDEGVTALREVVGQYEVAAQNDDAEALTAAVEQLHARFEALVGLTRPPMKELDAYHVVLYRIFHHYLPDQKQTELAEAAGELVIRARALQGAELPARLSGDQPAFSSGFDRLAELSAELETLMQGDPNWEQISTAVDAVHAQYQKIEALLE